MHPSVRIRGTSLTGDDKGEILYMLQFFLTGVMDAVKSGEEGIEQLAEHDGKTENGSLMYTNCPLALKHIQPTVTLRANDTSQRRPRFVVLSR